MLVLNALFHRPTRASAAERRVSIRSRDHLRRLSDFVPLRFEQAEQATGVRLNGEWRVRVVSPVAASTSSVHCDCRAQLRSQDPPRRHVCHSHSLGCRGPFSADRSSFARLYMQGARSRDAIVPAPARWAHYPGFFGVQEGGAKSNRRRLAPSGDSQCTREELRATHCPIYVVNYRVWGPRRNEIE